MAPNSLFAVLLRSPWWISIALAVGFVAAAHALLPPDWRLPAALGALPFFVIGCMALRRQLRAPSAGETTAILEALSRLSWTEVQAALALGFERQGYTVELLRSGADLRLVRGGQVTLVAARRWKAAHHGQESLTALHTAARDAGARAVYVCVPEPSPQARRFAAQHGLEILQAPQLVELLRRVPLPGR